MDTYHTLDRLYRSYTPLYRAYVGIRVLFKWSSFEDFKLDKETHIPPFRIKNLLARIDEAEAHANEDDKAVFRNLRELVNIVPRAEIRFKESRRTKDESLWLEEKNKFYTIRRETQQLLSTRVSER